MCIINILKKNKKSRDFYKKKKKPIIQAYCNRTI